MIILDNNNWEWIIKINYNYKLNDNNNIFIVKNSNYFFISSFFPYDFNPVTNIIWLLC